MKKRIESTTSGLSRQFEQIGPPLSIVYEDSNLYLTLPDNTFVYELCIIYESGDLKFGKLESRAEVQMTNNDTYQGKFSLLSAAETDTMIALPIFINNKTSDVTIQFKASDEEGTIISQMTQGFTLYMIPKEYELKQAYPNPFNPVNTIGFGLPTETQVSIIIYNLQGREIVSLVNDKMEAGYHSVIWNADSHASGVYFVKMVAGEYINTQKLMLVK